MADDPHRVFARSLFIHPVRGGQPERVWIYRNAEGEPQSVRALYNGVEPPEALTWAWAKTSYQTIEAPNVLYGLERLQNAAAGKRVILTDTLESADRAYELWPERGAVLAVTGAWRNTNYSALQGKIVLVWCQAGEFGNLCAREIAIGIQDIAKSVSIVKVPKPDGWSLANALDSERDSLRELAKKHTEVWPHFTLPPPDPVKDAKPAKEPILPPAAPVEGLTLRCSAQVQEKPLQPIWEGVLYRGKVMLLAGDPGVFKSGVTIDMAARISSGRRFPLCTIDNPPENVIIVSAEDSPEDTIKPRLNAAGADHSRIFYADCGVLTPNEDGTSSRKPLTLDEHMRHLAQSVKDVEPALVIIDPISAFMGKANSHNNAEVRGVLLGLSEIAQAHEVAIAVVSHLTKSAEQSAVNRVSGSLAFAAAARSVFIVLKDEQDPKRRMVVSAKNNLAADTRGFAFSLAIADNDYPFALWSEEALEMTAQEALDTSTGRSRAKADRVQEVATWLKGYLTPDPVPSRSVEFEARRLGFTKHHVNEAKKVLKVRLYQRDFQGPWFWELPKEG